MLTLIAKANFFPQSYPFVTAIASHFFLANYAAAVYNYILSLPYALGNAISLSSISSYSFAYAANKNIISNVI